MEFAEPDYKYEKRADEIARTESPDNVETTTLTAMIVGF
jgi:hypothetical protein